MKKFICFLIVVFAFFPALAKEESETAEGKTPKWVNSPLSGCKMSEICVIGSGSSLNQSKVDAQNEMLRVFENNLKSSFKAEISANNDELKEFSSEQVESLTSGMVSGTIIKKTFKDEDGVYYAWAVLNKHDLRENLKGEIEGIDKKLSALAGEGVNSSNLEMKNLYNYREALNRRYAFLNEGKGLDETVSFKDVLKHKQKRKNKSVFINIAEPKGKRLYNGIKKILHDDGITVTNSNYNVEIKGELFIEREHMNVEGFIKNLYIFNVEAFDLEGKSLGSLNISFPETGRSESQIENKALPKIISEIKDNFDELGI